MGLTQYTSRQSSGEIESEVGSDQKTNPEGTLNQTIRPHTHHSTSLITRTLLQCLIWRKTLRHVL